MQDEEMTRTQLEELAKRLEHIGVHKLEPFDDAIFLEAAAVIRELLEQEPVQCNPADYCVARHIKCYAAPVPAVDLAEWKREAMRLENKYVTCEWGTPECGETRSALQSHLDKIGGQT
jgi:hypothetical protein